MPSAEDFIKEFLSHADYDPAARREYYLRTRELKGKRPGTSSESTPNSNGGVVGPIGRSKTSTDKSSDPKLTSAQKQVEELKARLAKLREVLEKLVDQAQKRSGQAAPSSTSKQTQEKKSADKAPEKKLTPKQEADARKRAAEAYAKEKNKPISQVAKELKTKIADINAKIKAMREKLSKTKLKDVPKMKPVPVGAGTKKK